MNEALIFLAVAAIGYGAYEFVRRRRLRDSKPKKNPYPWGPSTGGGSNGSTDE